MSISFSPSLSGIRAAQTGIDNTAHSIANVNTEPFTPRRMLQSETAPSGTEVTGFKETTTDLARDMTDLTVYKNSYSANLKMVKVQNTMLGELLDIVA